MALHHPDQDFSFPLDKDVIKNNRARGISCQGIAAITSCFNVRDYGWQIV